MTITFNDLLAKASANGSGNFDDLAKEKTKLAADVGTLEQALAANRDRLREIDGLIAAPVKAAVRAAELLGIEVPDEYATKTAKDRTAERSQRTEGAYLWEPSALPGSNRNEDPQPRTLGLSRGLWSYSQGSGGSAGRRNEGVLTVNEFKDLLQNQTGKSEIAPGESVKVKLGNGREIKLTRLADQ